MLHSLAKDRTNSPAIIAVTLGISRSSSSAIIAATLSISRPSFYRHLAEEPPKPRTTTTAATPAITAPQRTAAAELAARCAPLTPSPQGAIRTGGHSQERPGHVRRASRVTVPTRDNAMQGRSLSV